MRLGSRQRLIVRNPGCALDLRDRRVRANDDLAVPVEVRVQLGPRACAWGRAALALHDDCPIALPDGDESGPEPPRIEAVARGDLIRVLIGETLPPGAEGRRHDCASILVHSAR